MREVAITRAFRVPSGAQIFGGRHDGLAILRAIRDEKHVVLLLADGSEQRCDRATEIAWLHPSARKATA